MIEMMIESVLMAFMLGGVVGAVIVLGASSAIRYRAPEILQPQRAAGTWRPPTPRRDQSEGGSQ